MKTNRSYLIIGLFVFLFILISGCSLQEDDESNGAYGGAGKISNEPINEPINESLINAREQSSSRTDAQETLPLASNKGLGNLCSGEGECIDFCLNNRGLCEGYCKGNHENGLCALIFPTEQKEKTEKLQQIKPVLKNLGIKIESWDKSTNRAGDFLFENKNYADNKIFTEFAHKIVNDMGEKLLPEIGFNVPVGTKVVSPIDGVITDVKFYEPSQDYLVYIKTEESSPWIVGFEHIYNVRMKSGERGSAGQELAEVSPSYGRTEFGNVEINVWTGGQSILKYCPFEFLEESLKPLDEEKINRLASDWEEFVGEDIYNQNEWVAPGCLLHNLTER